MDLTDGFTSKERREPVQSAASGSEDPLDSSNNSPKSRKGYTPKSPQVHGKASPVSYDRHSHSPRDGRPKKGKNTCQSS